MQVWEAIDGAVDMQPSALVEIDRLVTVSAIWEFQDLHCRFSSLTNRAPCGTGAADWVQNVWTVCSQIADLENSETPSVLMIG